MHFFFTAYVQRFKQFVLIGSTLAKVYDLFA